MLKYSAKYFEKTKKIMLKHKPNAIVILQFFQRQDNILVAGIDEALQMLQKNTDTSKYIIRATEEGTVLNGFEVVLELEGQYQYFGEYEGIIDGILARASSLATNAMNVVKAANGKPVIYMGDRADHYQNQELDGKYIALGGISIQTTDAHVALHDGKAIGTMPHALIQMFEGDLIKALHAYKDTFPNEALTALVDFNNDVIGETLKAFKEFPNDLNAIRVDTSENMSDKMFLNDEEYGVTSNMIKKLRSALDEVGGTKVKIIVSSGFNATKISAFEKTKTPVDYYGVGGSLLKISCGFTADAVMIDGIKLAKQGRKYRKHNLNVIK